MREQSAFVMENTEKYKEETKLPIIPRWAGTNVSLRCGISYILMFFSYYTRHVSVFQTRSLCSYSPEAFFLFFSKVCA